MNTISIQETIKAKAPNTAQFYLTIKDEDVVMYYRIIPMKFNDNTEGEQLQYYSSFNN